MSCIGGVWRLVIFYFYSFLFCVYLCMCRHACGMAWRSENSLWKLVLSLYQRGSRDWTQVFRVVSKHLYLLCLPSCQLILYTHLYNCMSIRDFLDYVNWSWLLMISGTVRRAHVNKASLTWLECLYRQGLQSQAKVQWTCVSKPGEGSGPGE